MDNNFQSETSENAPNTSLAFTLFTPIFGNGSFQIQPASPGAVQAGFSTVPYLSLEALIYQQQSMSTQASPSSITGGGNNGQQVVSSNQVTQDSTGTARSLNGFQNTT